MNAAQQLLAGAPTLTALAVDFKRNTWTFSLPAQPVGPGDYRVVRADEAIAALQQPAGIVLQEVPAGVRASFRDQWGGNGQAMSIGDIDDDGFEVQLYREHAPDVGREKYWSGPAVWWGSETRMGSDGHEWVRSGLRLVCDDFGNLVSVR